MGQKAPDPGSGSAKATVYHFFARILEPHLFEKPDQRLPSGAGLRVRIRKDLSSCDLLDPDPLALEIFEKVIKRSCSSRLLIVLHGKIPTLEEFKIV
jgi:hypothetical protein